MEPKRCSIIQHIHAFEGSSRPLSASAQQVRPYIRPMIRGLEILLRPQSNQKQRECWTSQPRNFGDKTIPESGSNGPTASCWNLAASWQRPPGRLGERRPMREGGMTLLRACCAVAVPRLAAAYMHAGFSSLYVGVLFRNSSPKLSLFVSTSQFTCSSHHSPHPLQPAIPANTATPQSCSLLLTYQNGPSL
jgi:hypothetical protein